MTGAEITIYGAGVFGLSVAYACARRGARVQVIDPQGVGAGSSGGIVGALAPHVPDEWNDKKQFQFESLVMARDFWAGVADLSGQDPGYMRSGRLQPLADATAAGLAQARAVSARDLWQGQAHWAVVGPETLGQWKPFSPSGLWVHDTLSARIHPRRATAALAGAVTALGGVIRADGTAQGKVVHATGWKGLIEIATATGRPFGNGVKGQAVLLDHAMPDAPQLFAEALHVVPHGDGTLAIGSTSERDFSNPAATDALVEDLLARAVAAFPFLAGVRVIERWAGVRPRSKTRSPILGEHPLFPGQFMANGGFKIGFGMAPKVGEVMADLMLEGRGDGIPPGFLPAANL